ncbi:hypothetical protein E6O75_ATG05375 [Venturia nashicola]|uniref:Uncharacterized protein n=1 Tax=Venturia nashicola TaxID=86259 RepID=A0A4Z1P7V5_9PEZI|nr:hypothetical protein E6O75_ATG05375 [Venturia nashicola]
MNYPVFRLNAGIINNKALLSSSNQVYKSEVAAHANDMMCLRQECLAVDLTDNSPPANSKTNFEFGSNEHNDEKTTASPRLSQLLRTMAGLMARLDS